MLKLTEDVIDTRDIINVVQETENYIEALKEDLEDPSTSAEETEQILENIENEKEDIAPLREFIDEYEDEITGFYFGEQLIAKDYFTEYAQELATEIGAVSSDMQWPLYCIDWDRAAEELQQDYIEVVIDGYEFWVRA